MDPDLVLASQDYKKLERTHWKAGFKEGVEEGKEAVTTRGFRSGFKAGVEAGVRWGRLSGRVSAVVMFLQQHNCPLSKELSSLKDRAERSQERAEEGGGGGEEGDVREFGEVAESMKVSFELKELEEELEDIISKLV